MGSIDEAIAVMEAAIKTLPARVQYVVRQRKVHRRSVEEIAEDLGVPAEVVEERLVEGLTALTIALGEAKLLPPMPRWRRKLNLFCAPWRFIEAVWILVTAIVRR
jgi:hypothetical protein